MDDAYTGVHGDGMGLLSMKSTPQRLKTVLTSLRLGVLMDWDSPIDSGSVPDSETAFDVIVVGGGPGGSGAAGYMAMKGLKVLLLEKAIWPRDKTCGDAVGGKSLKHVEELGVKVIWLMPVYPISMEKRTVNQKTYITFFAAS